MIYIILLAIGVLGALLLVGKALSGPSPRKAIKRRMELVKERHADGILAANAQAQIPKPALMRKRLDQTGKPITLAKYAMASLGLAGFVAALAMIKGAPFVLAF